MEQSQKRASSLLGEVSSFKTSCLDLKCSTNQIINRHKVNALDFFPRNPKALVQMLVSINIM